MIRSLVVILISIVVWCSNIYGQDIQTSQMSVDRYKIYSLDSGKVLGGGELDYNVSMNYSRDALVDSYSNIALIKNYNQVNIGGTYGLIGGRLSIGGSVGYNYITGDRGGVISYKSGGDNIRVMPKLRVYSILGVDIGLSVVISVPTDSGVYSNIYRVLISGDSIWKLKDVRWVINIGYKDGGGVVNKGEVKTNYFGNGMIVGLGVVYKVMGVWDIKGEVKYSGGLGDVIDGIIGFRYDGWLIVGVGQGFTGGIGSVSYRGVVGVEGGVVIKRDKDGDGVMDSVDRCEGDSEDKDGYLDEDGCPDLDNDGDGVMDIYDRCVGEKEVMNGYRDYDGCEDEVIGGDVDDIYFVKGGDEVIVGKSYVVLKRVVDMVVDFSRSGKWEVVLEIRCRSRGRGESVGREIKGMVGEIVKINIVEDIGMGDEKVGFRIELNNRY